MESYYNVQSMKSMCSRGEKKAMSPLPKESIRSVSYEGEERAQPPNRVLRAVKNPLSPQQVPDVADKPGDFPVLGGYAKSDISTSDNLEGKQWDLGIDGAFGDFSVLVMMFVNFLEADWDSCAGHALRQKGFHVKLCTCNEVNIFLNEISSGKYSVVWIISSGGGYVDSWSVDSNRTFLKDDLKPSFISSVTHFHRTGGGLFLWADNEPYFYEVNLILHAILQETEKNDIALSGNTTGDRVLSFGKPEQPGEFDENHIIFAGIKYLYEGVTICYPNIVCPPNNMPTDKASPQKFSKQVGSFDVLATSSNGKPVILKMEQIANNGRVIVDSGWTKLYKSSWSSVGQARYVVNACVWLVNVEGVVGRKRSEKLEGVADEPSIVDNPAGADTNKCVVQ